MITVVRDTSPALQFTVAGLAGTVGLYNLFTSRMMPQRAVFLLFGLCGIALGAVCGLEGAIATTNDFVAATYYLRLSGFFVSLMWVTLVWSWAASTGDRASWPDKFVATGFIVLAVYSLVSPYGFWYISLDSLSTPSGIMIQHPIRGTAGWGYFLTMVLQYSLFGGHLWRSRWFFARKQIRYGLEWTLLWATVTIAQAHDHLICFGFLHGKNIGPSVFLLFFIILTARQALLINQAFVDSKRAELALRAEQAKFRDIFNASSDALFIHDPSTMRIVDVNQTAIRMYGHPRERYPRLVIGDLSAPADEFVEKRAIAYGADCLRDGSSRFEWQARRADGTCFPVEICLERLTLEGKVHVLAAVRDLTVQKEYEARLRQSQRLESIGQLASGIAHDFNNLLVPILGYAEILQARKAIKSDAESMAGLNEISLAAESARSLTQKLLAFGRKSVVRPAVIEVNELLGGFEKLLRRLLPSTITLRITLGPETGSVFADRVQLEQIVLNLVINARDAVGQQGVIEIRTTKEALEPAFASAHDCAAGTYVRIEVIDTGTGMPPEVLARIFEPFFTTKPLGKGSGLGLATVHGIVQQANGAIDVHSEVGKGSTFRVWIPEHHATGDTLPVPQLAPEVRGFNGKTVLLVEDDASVREFAKQALQHAGYVVIAHDRPTNAVRDFERHPEIALLLSDVILPEMRGPQLWKTLCQQRPNLRVLFMSGSLDPSGAPTLASELENQPFLQKPFSVAGLTGAVDEALEVLRAGEQA